MKIAVITCIFGYRDILVDPEIKLPNCDFFCFTDDPNIKSNIWKVKLIHLDNFDYDPNLATKTIKIYNYKYINISKYDIILWMDASYIICKDFSYFIKENFDENYDIMFYKHPKYHNLFQRALKRKLRKKFPRDESPSIINKINQYKKFFNSNFVNFLQGGIFFYRPNSEKFKKFFDIWFNETLQCGLLDQLSLPYSLKYSNISFCAIPSESHKSYCNHDWAKMKGEKVHYCRTHGVIDQYIKYLIYKNKYSDYINMNTGKEKFKKADIISIKSDVLKKNYINIKKLLKKLSINGILVIFNQCHPEYDVEIYNKILSIYKNNDNVESIGGLFDKGCLFLKINHNEEKTNKDLKWYKFRGVFCWEDNSIKKINKDLKWHNIRGVFYWENKIFKSNNKFFLSDNKFFPVAFQLNKRVGI